MTIKKDHINAYILAGGKSSRMGTDKGLLLFNDEQLIERIIKRLDPVLKRIIIVSNNPEYKIFNREVIADQVMDIGPAGGIHASLSHLQTSSAFIVSCDMPFVTTEAVQFMLNHSLGSQITVPEYKNMVQPLFGVYTKDCLQKWKHLVEKKLVKLQEMLTHFEVKKINTENEKLFNEFSFMNINDPNDLRAALQHL